MTLEQELLILEAIEDDELLKDVHRFKKVKVFCPNSSKKDKLDPDELLEVFPHDECEDLTGEITEEEWNKIPYDLEQRRKGIYMKYTYSNGAS